MQRRRFLQNAGTAGAALSLGLITRAVSAAPGAQGGSRVLVIFYSRAGENYAPGGTEVLEVGHTAQMARFIAGAAGADVYEIRTVDPYPQGYRETTELVQEQFNKNIRPKLAGSMPDLSKYDVVFFGHPIWWGRLPPPVRTFLDAADFSGLKVAHFCTHGGSRFGASDRELREFEPKAEYLEGMELYGTEDRKSVV